MSTDGRHRGTLGPGRSRGLDWPLHIQSCRDSGIVSSTGSHAANMSTDGRDSGTLGPGRSRGLGAIWRLMAGPRDAPLHHRTLIRRPSTLAIQLHFCNPAVPLQSSCTSAIQLHFCTPATLLQSSCISAPQLHISTPVARPIQPT
ncbi:hypothetical protein FHG87_014843 [Trinorchestia longiramus]|nr:hypothetical protein FHG87_014843 [Trinorchestia longiramus]